ncbi:hypothetical protein NFI95_02190 [Acetobacteraceae bacterium KSS8]|uniref:Secreted protein n=1 Tax=Endosaccharibacter trunci TaxID=2812733 RepID=A0ABT1W322_9PROT|nr:hypothetical protein [Acetobacteraceae bacterium KSS8]
MNRLEQSVHLVLLALERDRQFAQVEEPFAGLLVPALRRGLQLAAERLQRLHGLLRLPLQLSELLLDRLHVHDTSPFPDGEPSTHAGAGQAEPD